MAFVGYFNSTKAVPRADVVLKTSHSKRQLAAGEVADMIDRWTICNLDDSIDGMSCQAPRYRTADSLTPARDMQAEIHTYAYPPMFQVVVIVVGAVCLFAALFCLGTLFYFREHRLIKFTQPPVLALVFAGYAVIAVRVLAASTDTLSPGYCVAEKWLGHIGFSAAFVPLIVKLWRLDKIVNGKSLKRVKINDGDALKVCGSAVAPLMLLLVVDTAVAYAESNSESEGFLRFRRAESGNQYTFSHFCGLAAHPASVVFTAFVYAYQCLTMSVALVFLWRTRQLPANINEVGSISPMVFAVILIVVVTASLVGIMDIHPYLNSLIVNLAFSFGLLTSIYYYWLPKLLAIFIEHLHHRRAAADAADDSDRLSAGSGQSKWSALRSSMTKLATAVAANNEQDVEGNKKSREEKNHEERRKGLLEKLKQQSLPIPTNRVQELLIEELVDLRGSNLRAALCQKHIGYIQGIIVALSQSTDDSSNNSSSKPSSTTFTTAEQLETSTAALYSREKPESSSLPR